MGWGTRFENQAQGHVPATANLPPTYPRRSLNCELSDVQLPIPGPATIVWLHFFRSFDSGIADKSGVVTKTIDKRCEEIVKFGAVLFVSSSYSFASILVRPRLS